MILTHQMVSKQILEMSFSDIKKIIKRQRLKFNKQQIIFYLMCLVEQQDRVVFYKTIYKEKIKNGLITIDYEGFLENLKLFSPLFKSLFLRFNQNLGIKPSQLFNMSDTSLLPTKEEKSITYQDKDKNMVTVRKTKKKVSVFDNKTKINSKKEIEVKDMVCGYKALVFCNRKKQITFAQLLNINVSDMNILKNPLFYLSKGLCQGFLAVDRGMSCMEMRKRFDSINSNPQFDYMRSIYHKTKLLSPYHYKQKDKNLSSKEWKLYTKRWGIETVFQSMKNILGETKLNLKGARNYNLIEAKYFIAIIKHNLSTIF